MSYDYIIDYVTACCHCAEGTEHLHRGSKGGNNWISSSSHIRFVLSSFDIQKLYLVRLSYLFLLGAWQKCEVCAKLELRCTAWRYVCTSGRLPLCPAWTCLPKTALITVIHSLLKSSAPKPVLVLQTCTFVSIMFAWEGIFEAALLCGISQSTHGHVGIIDTFRQW